MKKSKKIMAIIVIVILLGNCCMMFDNRIYAASSIKKVRATAEAYNEILKGVYSRATNPYEFSPQEFTEVYAHNSTYENGEPGVYMRFAIDAKENGGIPLKQYEGEEVIENSAYQDNKIMADDCSNFLGATPIDNKVSEENIEELQDYWLTGGKSRSCIINDIRLSLINGLGLEGIESNDILVSVEVKIPKIQIGEFSMEQASFKINTDEKFSGDTKKYIIEYSDKMGKLKDEDINNPFKFDITATINKGEKNKKSYGLVIGTDDNFYLMEKATTYSGIFTTDLNYKSYDESKTELEGKMDGKIYLPPYYDNDNNKKDADVTVTIQSKTEEEIIKTNEVAILPENTKDNPNSEGYYYPDSKNRKVIAKDYPFDKYDNITNNGAITETVELTGEFGGESEQSPSIDWTLRRKTKTHHIEKDGSTTVTIIYNLPIDEKDIKEGWKPGYGDSEEKGIHRIYRNFPQGTSYDEDVIVKRNGRPTETVTTRVTIGGFETDLSYKSDVEGELKDDVYYPQYTVDEDSNAKKDLDVKAQISSKTDEEITKTNAIDLTADGKPNSEGWYYPDVNNKKVIEKVYKFDEYDNIKDNGKVNETVKLTGAKGGESTENPQIVWTFRRIDKKQTVNSDGSTTVVIKYNLPVDKDTIEDGWAPIYDEDKVTIHAITKTIPNGEGYDKDVIVSQNGNPSAKVTTPVKVEKNQQGGKDDKADGIPNAGAFTVRFIVIGIVIAAFAITRFKKMKK